MKSQYALPKAKFPRGNLNLDNTYGDFNFNKSTQEESSGAFYERSCEESRHDSVYDSQ
jgi:hypothetical protein